MVSFVGCNTAPMIPSALCADLPPCDGAAAFYVPQVLQLTTPKMRQEQVARYTAQRTNFFALLRFDFMVDEHMLTYLIEVRH